MPAHVAEGGILLAAAIAKHRQGRAPAPFGMGLPGLVLYRGWRMDGETVVVDCGPGETRVALKPPAGGEAWTLQALRLFRGADGGWAGEGLWTTRRLETDGG